MTQAESFQMQWEKDEHNSAWKSLHLEFSNKCQAQGVAEQMWAP